MPYVNCTGCAVCQCVPCAKCSLLCSSCLPGSTCGVAVAVSGVGCGDGFAVRRPLAGGASSAGALVEMVSGSVSGVADAGVAGVESVDVGVVSELVVGAAVSGVEEAGGSLLSVDEGTVSAGALSAGADLDDSPPTQPKPALFRA